MATTQKNVTLYHPAFGTPLEVPAASVDAHVEAGWRKSRPKAAADTSAPDAPAPIPTTTVAGS